MDFCIIFIFKCYIEMFFIVMTKTYDAPRGFALELSDPLHPGSQLRARVNFPLSFKPEHLRLTWFLDPGWREG